MSTRTGEDQPRRKTLWVWVGVAVAAVVVVWVSVALWPTSTDGAAPGPSSSATGSPSPSVTEVATPSATPSGDATDPSATPDARPTQPPGARPTQPPVDLEDEVEVSDGLGAELVKIESVEGVVTIPGEVAGPALRITLRVTNDTADDFATPAMVVNLYTGKDLTPAGPLLKPGGKEFPQTVPSGKSATGVYLFTVPKDQRDDVTVEVDLGVGTPVVVFRGDAI